MKTAIVVGVGLERGLGARLCTRFAAWGLYALFAGRTEESLDAIVDGLAHLTASRAGTGPSSST